MSKTINYSGNTADWTSSTSSGTKTIRITGNHVTGGSGVCNESEVHDNDQKALFHGMKSAFRMSRPYDGTEYGTEDPQHETAARIAANVALAYVEAADVDYDREESFEYLRENVVADPHTVDRLLILFGMKDRHIRVDMGTAGSDDLRDGIERAWEQVDSKGHHDDGARTALAAAEAFLGEKFHG